MPGKSKRLRIMAGPNGSGKSTIINEIRNSFYCGAFVNADEIHIALKEKGAVGLGTVYGLHLRPDAFHAYLQGRGVSWIHKAATGNSPVNIYFSNDDLRVDTIPGDYDAAIAADFVRHQLLYRNNTFTFETVLSHRSKLAFLTEAAHTGYKNYLYFVCTVDPQINIARVAQRVALGGHEVPPERIVSRYYASLALLPELIGTTYKTFLFDNSMENTGINMVAEIIAGQTFTPHTEAMPWWVQEHVITPLFG